MSRAPLGWAACAMAGVALGACQAQGPSSAPATPLAYEVIHASATCGTEDTSVRRIADEGRLKHMLDGSRMLGGSAPSPRPDFERSLVLRVSMGQQPTAGGQLAVTGARTEGSRERLVIETTWQRPDPQRMNAAVVTRPCVIVSVPSGPYRSVQVVDQQRQVKTEASLAGPGPR